VRKKIKKLSENFENFLRCFLGEKFLNKLFENRVYIDTVKLLCKLHKIIILCNVETVKSVFSISVALENVASFNFKQFVVASNISIYLKKKKP